MFSYMRDDDVQKNIVIFFNNGLPVVYHSIPGENNEC